MARNSEKANLMFNRWTSLKEEQTRGGPARPERRPHLASECRILSEAEKWRRTIIGEMTRAIGEIQNAGLGEARLRDLNDAINKLSRERGHWERQIKALGGADHAVASARVLEGEGLEPKGSKGYRYYGAAKELPGVKDLLARAAAPAVGEKRMRGDAAKHFSPDYFGWRDEDDDGTLLREEVVAERRGRAAAIAEWDSEREKARAAAPSISQTLPAWEDLLPVGLETTGVGGASVLAAVERLWIPAASGTRNGNGATGGGGGGGGSGEASSKSATEGLDIAALLAARRKALLNETYASDGLSALNQESASLLPPAPK